MNATPSIALYKEPEVALATSGILPDEMQSILGAFPRLEMKRAFTDSVRHLIKTRPETTYDAIDRGLPDERFVRCVSRPWRAFQP